uniref:Uncharacterized protein n=1 Tax=Glossina pallidipes TaxID=7398 RepID=A0A1B0A347_GLOPL
MKFYDTGYEIIRMKLTPGATSKGFHNIKLPALNNNHHHHHHHHYYHYDDDDDDDDERKEWITNKRPKRVLLLQPPTASHTTDDDVVNDDKNDKQRSPKTSHRHQPIRVRLYNRNAEVLQTVSENLLQL